MKKELSDIQKNEDKKAKLSKFQIYILYFFLFAFIGWCMETLYANYNFKQFIKRGFLYGPICPIYGWGALMLIIFLNKYRKHNFKLFIYAAVIFSVFEYFVSYCMDAMFSMHWWDYTNEFLNLNGRISIFYSLTWGVIAILFINYIYPFFQKRMTSLTEKTPYKVQLIILYILSTTFIIDTTMSFIRYLKM